MDAIDLLLLRLAAASAVVGVIAVTAGCCVCGGCGAKRSRSTWFKGTSRSHRGGGDGWSSYSNEGPIPLNTGE
jgi:hypothetical protein